MLELTINGAVFQFHFGMGFMREINKKIGKPIDGIPGEKENIGLRYYVIGILNNDTDFLEEVLLAANKSQNPRITRDLLDSYIDDEDTDIDALFSEVLDFLRRANATKNVVKAVEEALAAEKAKAQK